MSPKTKRTYEGGVIEISHAGRWVVTPVRAWRYRGTSSYQDIAIGDVDFMGTCLFLDGWMQLAEADEYVYHEHLVLPPLLAHPQPSQVLILGGGDGLAAREALRHAQVAQVTLVDLDEDVVNACRVHLAHLQEGALDDPRLDIYIADARDILQHPETQYDVILVDLVDLMPATLGLFEDVFAHIHAALKPGGVVVTHGPDPGPPQYEGLLAVAFMRQSFKHVVWYKGFITSFGETWTFVMGSNEVDFTALSPEQWRKRMEHWRGTPRSLVPEALPAMFLHPKSTEDIIAQMVAGTFPRPTTEWHAVVLSGQQMKRLQELTEQ